VIADGTDLHGDGVNAAVRLQAESQRAAYVSHAPCATMCTPGSVLPLRSWGHSI
jgi:hypothetical protein